MKNTLPPIKKKILTESMKAIQSSLPQLSTFVRDGKVEAQLEAFLDQLEQILAGEEGSIEPETSRYKQAKEFAQSALASKVAVEDLVQITFLFRRAFWTAMEAEKSPLTALERRDLLPTVRKMNEYLSQITLAMVHEYLTKERDVVATQRGALEKRQAQLEADLALAKRIQQSMFPSYCQFRGFKLCAHMLPSGSVGGDFYNVIPFGAPETRVDLYIGDVQGKGIPAALIMMMMTTTLWDVASIQSTPHQILSAANRRFRMHLTEELMQFVSLYYLSYDVDRHQITYAKAGHEDAVLIRKNGELEILSVSGYFLGIFDDVDYEERKLKVEPGDRIYLYTDGITVVGPSPDKRLDYDRFFSMLKRHNASPIGNALESIFAELMAMQGKNPLKDDVGIVVVEF